MKVLIGVDPHKASVAVAAIDEATGELLDRASFPQDRSGPSSCLYPPEGTIGTHPDRAYRTILPESCDDPYYGGRRVIWRRPRLSGRACPVVHSLCDPLPRVHAHYTPRESRALPEKPSSWLRLTPARLTNVRTLARRSLHRTSEYAAGRRSLLP